MSVEINQSGRIDGSRTTIYHVMDYYEDRIAPEEIIQWLPLTLEQVLAAIRYIEDNKSEVLLQYQKILDRCDKGGPPEVEERIQKRKELMRAYFKMEQAHAESRR